MGEVKLISATSLKSGRYVVFDDQCCIVKSVEVSRPGKHGHAKCRIEAVTIKDGKKIIKIMPGHDKIGSPVIEKNEAQVLSVQDDKANVMDLKTFETYDLEIPKDFKDKVKEGVKVIYWELLQDKVIKEVREE
jgi:translation initiation factor 5A